MQACSCDATIIHGAAAGRLKVEKLTVCIAALAWRCRECAPEAQAVV